MNGRAQSTAPGENRSSPSTRSNTEFRLPIHFRQVVLENRLGYIDGRENVGDQTDRQRNGKAANRSSAEQKEKESGHHSGDVSIDDSQESLVETGLHRGRGRFAIAQLFANALEDQYVGIHAHTDRQNDAGDSGQRQYRAERGKRR